jgi:hypothetical protein
MDLMSQLEAKDTMYLAKLKGTGLAQKRLLLTYGNQLKMFSLQSMLNGQMLVVFG